ncbi:AAA family ATPase [Magnetospira sp. QH-2]|uniref:AAA family ATPase n=1 Tax=Magnetospira sp. (strain QH-2) TaxID=1288970 RepID=UPI0003E813F7|nr:AAA family ATPase [Magnetospira sp. QH-2]CCQ73552.1 Putative response regulator receiver domain protein (CheY-like) [Magnetospira sp. QH-2]
MTLPAPTLDMNSDRAPWAAFVGDDMTRQALLSVAREHGWSEDSVLLGDAAEALRHLAGQATPKLLVLDLAGSADPLDELLGLADHCDPGTRVIALGTVNDVNLYRQLMDVGVEDYLLKPVNGDALRDAVEHALIEPEPDVSEPEDDDKARLITVIGARGGVGATTVAVNTAWILAHEKDKRVALVDLDLYFGTTALALDLEPGRGFREALENPARIDSLFIERAMVRESDNLFVLDTEETMGQAIHPDPTAIDQLLEKMRDSFDMVVVDLPRESLSNTSALTESGEVILVADLTIAGIRDTLRIHEYLVQSAPQARLTVVANRVGLMGRGEMTRGEFEKGAEVPVDISIPFDIAGVLEAANQGKAVPEVANRGKPVTALRDLSTRILHDETVDGDSRPAWKRLLGLKGGL